MIGPGGVPAELGGVGGPVGECPGGGGGAGCHIGWLIGITNKLRS